MGDTHILQDTFGLGGSRIIKPDLTDTVAAAWTKPAGSESSSARNLVLGGAAVAIGAVLHEKPAVVARAVEEGVELIGKTDKALFTPKAWDTAKGVRKLADVLTTKRLQVDRAGDLQSYFTGRVAATLLAKAGRFTEISGDSLPAVVRGNTIQFNQTALEHLTGMVRKTGDVDVSDLATAHVRYGDSWGLFMHSELPKSARNAFVESSPYLSVHVEATTRNIGADEIVSVPFKDKEIFVAHPVSQMSWKLASALNQWGHVPVAKNTGDFEHLLGVASTLRSEPELVQAASKAFSHFEPKIAEPIFTHKYDPQYRGPLKEFAEKVIAANPDSKYLSGIHHGPEHAFGYLRVLNRLESDTDKKAVVDFINNNKDSFNYWKVNWESAANHRRVAQEILNEYPKVLQDLRSQGIVSQAQITAKVADDIILFNKIAEPLPNRALELLPAPSETLQNLYTMDVTRVPAELARIARTAT